MHRTFRVTVLLALAAWLSLGLSACGSDVLNARGVSWAGMPLPLAVRTETPDAAALQPAGLAVLAAQAPRRFLLATPGEWGDSLVLVEFAGDVEAYAAFQLLAGTPEELEAGQAVCGGRVCFRKGRWIGALDAWSWRGSAGFDAALELPGGAAMGSLPSVFGAMLHAGRIRGSERVLRDDFMGARAPVTIYAVRMACGEDRAWLYAAPGMGRGFATELLAFPGWSPDTAGRTLVLYRELADWPPAELRFGPGGMVGVEGCHDPVLTRHWLNSQKNGLKKLK